MYQHFGNEEAGRVMNQAAEAAHAWRHEYVGTEHLLWGILQTPESGGLRILLQMKIDPNKLDADLKSIVKSGIHPVPPGPLPQTPRAKKIIEYALEESQGLQSGERGSEYLLLGMLREAEGVAAQVLMNTGLRLEDARKAVCGDRPPDERVTEFRVILPRQAVEKLEQFRGAQGSRTRSETLRKLLGSLLDPLPPDEPISVEPVQPRPRGLM